jgi:23S rRNA pseudouridine1911/1915/1917 synthase
VQILEHKWNEKHNEVEVIMFRIRGRCFSFFYALITSRRASVPEFQLKALAMIEILLEHPWFLVINKPSGLLTQAVPGIVSVQTELVAQLQARDPSSPVPFIGLPHRLDRVTSGAMVVARNQRSLRRLSDQFAARTVKKLYHAMVPAMTEPNGTWVDWMRKIPDQAKAEIVLPEADGAKEAVLSFRKLRETVLATDSKLLAMSIVEIELQTGRMHQIRLQFGTRGHAIVGDEMYGSPLSWRGAVPGERESPIALHAASIEFRNPQNAERIEVKTATVFE